MTNIPLAREILRDAWRMAKERGQDDICSLIAEAGSMMTRKVRPQSRTVSTRMTSEIVAHALTIINDQPHLTDREIGDHLNVSCGRICEVRNGKRTIDDPTMSADGLNRRMANNRREKWD